MILVSPFILSGMYNLYINHPQKDNLELISKPFFLRYQNLTFCSDAEQFTVPESLVRPLCVKAGHEITNVLVTGPENS